MSESPSGSDDFVSSRRRGSGHGPAFRLLCELGGVRMAAILIGALALTIATATLYERSYGAQVAGIMVYQSWWFTALFALLAACLIAAVTVRLPLRRHQYGFAVVHLGLLTLMGGFWMHGYHRLDGMLEAVPGSEAARIELPTDALTVVEGQQRQSASFQPIIDAGYPSLLRFLLRDMWIDQPARINELPRPKQLLNSPNLRVELTAVLDTGGPDPGFAAAASGPPAALVSVLAKPAGTEELQPLARSWFAPGRETILDQGLVVASYMVASSPFAAESFTAPLPPATADGDLVVGLADRSLRVPVELGRVQPLGPDLAIRVDRILRNPRPVDGRLVQQDDARIDPVVEYSIGRGSAASQTWTTRFASAYILASGGDGFPDVRFEHPLIYSPGEGLGAYLQLLAVPGPDGHRLFVRWFTRSKGLAGTTEVRRTWSGAIAGGQSGPMQVHTIIDWLPHATAAPEPVNMQAGKQDHAMRWAKFRFTTPEGSSEHWFHRNEVNAVQIGARTFFVSYRRAVYDLRERHGFAIRLERFDEGKDPGGMRSASFSSEITVLPAGKDPYPALVTMNEPLHHAGVTLYQTAFRPETDAQQRPTGRQISIFTAATDPGRALKYLGSLLLVGGIMLLYLLRRSRS